MGGELLNVEWAHVLKIDVESREMLLLDSCSHSHLNIQEFSALPTVSGGQCIFLGYDKLEGRMMAKKVGDI